MLFHEFLFCYLDYKRKCSFTLRTHTEGWNIGKHFVVATKWFWIVFNIIIPFLRECITTIFIYKRRINVHWFSFFHTYTEIIKVEILGVTRRHSAMMRPNNFTTSSFEWQHRYEKKWLIKIPLSFVFKSNCFLLTNGLAHMKLQRQTVQIAKREIAFNLYLSWNFTIAHFCKFLKLLLLKYNIYYNSKHFCN